MTRIILHGCYGKMGQMVAEMLDRSYAYDCEIVAGVDPADMPFNGGGHTFGSDIPVFKNIRDCDVEADVVIDFSTAEAVENLIDYCHEHNLPVVICTTGLSESLIQHIEKISSEIPVMRSANHGLSV